MREREKVRDRRRERMEPTLWLLPQLAARHWTSGGAIDPVSFSADFVDHLHTGTSKVCVFLL